MEKRFLLWDAEQQIQDMLQDQNMLTPAAEKFFRKQFQQIEEDLNCFLGNESENPLNRPLRERPSRHNRDKNPTIQYNDNQDGSALPFPSSRRHKNIWTKPATGLYRIFSVSFLLPWGIFPKNRRSDRGFSYSIPATARMNIWNTRSKNKYPPRIHPEKALLFQQDNFGTLEHNDCCSSFTPITITVTVDNVSPDDRK